MLSSHHLIISCHVLLSCRLSATMKFRCISFFASTTEQLLPILQSICYVHDQIDITWIDSTRRYDVHDGTLVGLIVLYLTTTTVRMIPKPRISNSSFIAHTVVGLSLRVFVLDGPNPSSIICNCNYGIVRGLITLSLVPYLVP